jgi:hypothetical protein
MYNEGSSKIVKQTINGQKNRYGPSIYGCIGVEKEKKRLKHCKFYGKSNLHDNIDLSEKVYCMNLISHFLEI